MATSLGETSLAIDPLQNQNCNGSNASSSSSHTSSPSFQNDDNNQMFAEMNEDVLSNPKCENSQDTKLNENSSNGEGVFIFNNEINSSLLCNGISPKKEAIFEAIESNSSSSNNELNMNSVGSVENKKRKYENDNDNISNASSSTSNKRSNTSNSKSSKSASEDSEVFI
jgi:hypothetical protein